jgi:hypothetical protein
MNEARRALIDRGVEMGDVTDMGGVKYSGFSDPDGKAGCSSSGPKATGLSQPASVYQRPRWTTSSNGRRFISLIGCSGRSAG